MKRILPIVPFLLVVLAGWANMTKQQQQQMLSGGAMGAGTGATIGLIAGPPGALVEAVVGGAAGTVTGANWEGIKKAKK